MRKSTSVETGVLLKKLGAASPQRSRVSLEKDRLRAETLRESKKMLKRMMSINIPQDEDERALDGSPDLKEDLSLKGSTRQLFIPPPIIKSLNSPFSQATLVQNNSSKEFISMQVNVKGSKHLIKALYSSEGS